jgi:CheY-like chemotaxis protein
MRLSKAFGVKPKIRASGCVRCANTGYFGRLPINEVAVFTPAMLEHISHGATTTSALQEAAIAGGMRSLRSAGIDRVVRGETTLTELERVVGAVGSDDSVPAVEAAAPPMPAIFVVDDDPVQRLLVSSTLEKSGYRVSQACDGAEALRRIEAGEECALLLTDLHMPELDGDQLIRKLRADPRSAALPIVVLSGSAEDNRESELIDIGADDYIRKPVDPPRLLARVRAALRRVA